MSDAPVKMTKRVCRWTDCGAELRGRTHAEVRKAWRMHRLECGA